MPSNIRTDDQFWKHVGYVNIYDNPEERPSEFPEFNCMSDAGKLLTYVIGYYEQYTVWPEDYERFPKITPEYERRYSKLSPASQQCMLETLVQVEHPRRDPGDTLAQEIFNSKVLFSLFLLPIYCFTDEELEATDLLQMETDYLRCSINEWGGPLAMMAVMTGQSTDDVEQRRNEVEKVCLDDGNLPQTPGPTQ